MPVVTPEKIAVALGQPAPEPESTTWNQWAMWIDDAVMLIDSRIADLGAVRPDEAKIAYVVREAVVAQVKRPDDATQVTVSIDDGSSSRTYQSGKGRVTIADDWWKLLGLSASDGKAFSIDTVSLACGAHLAWCSLAFGAVFCSCGTDIAGRPIFELGD